MTERDIFLAAIEIADPAKRAACLQSACGADAALRERVERLIRSHQELGSFLASPAVGATAVRKEFSPTDHGVTQSLNPAADPPVSSGDGDEVLGFLAPPQRHDSLGRLGHYEMLQILGRGGFGVVFRAFDEKLQRVVAVKVMAPQLATTSPARKRFIREARSSAAVRHENVVQVYEVEEQPLPYLVMEFIPGVTLQEYLDETGPLETLEVIQIGRQIAEGLAAAHAKELIHRDIKPANVLIEGGPRKRVKITDFGLARAADDASISQSGVIAGTPMYMAPEQAKGHTLDQRADLFSLGSVLYQMVSGRPPFRANGTLAVLKRVADDHPRPIREIISDAPRWLCDLIATLHAKNPDDRIQTAKEVADILADCETQLKTHGKIQEFSRLPIVPTPSKKKDWRKFASVLGLIVLGFIVVEVASFGIRLLTNRGPVKVLSASGLVGIRIYEGDFATTAWLDPKKHPRIELSAGTYRVEADCAPGRFVERWLVTTHGLIGSHSTTQSTSSCEITFTRGEKLTIQPILRDVAPAPPTKPNPPSDGFVKLFNGKDLTGWTPSRRRDWRVENGEIVGSTDEDRFDYLISKSADFEDFHLRVEAKINAEGDSGIYFRNLHETTGYEAQICSSRRSPFGTGSLAIRRKTELGEKWQWLKTVSPSPVPADTWFTYEIVARGNEIVVRVDGVEVARVVDGTNRKGAIALELGKPGTVVHFRKIEIVKLPASPTSVEPSGEAKAQEAQSVAAHRLELPSEAKNSLGMTLRLIPPGEFDMGNSDDNPISMPDDKPRHRVKLTKPFYLGAHEVTVKQFRTFADETKLKTHAETDPLGAIVADYTGLNKKPGTNWRSPGFEQGDTNPVTCVTWKEAMAFCDWLSKKEKLTYRLPTDAEWEYACRAGTTTSYHFGPTIDPSRAAMLARDPKEAILHTRPVGSFPPNAFGLYDMHGNVYEWCFDGRRDFTKESVSDPVGPTDAKSWRIHRGGAWSTVFNGPGLLAGGRSLAEVDEAINTMGFRVAVVGDLKGVGEPTSPFKRP